MELTISKRVRLRRLCLGTLVSGGCTLAVAPGAWAQYTPPPPPLTTAPCQPTKKDPCPPQATTPVLPATADQFPFPGETKPAAPAASPAEAFPFPGEAPAAPNAPAGASKPAPSGSGQAFPFPGEPPSVPAPSSGASSSSSSSSSSGAPADNSTDEDSPPKDEGSSGSTRSSRRHLPKVEDVDKRESTDVEVSRYYFSTGDYKAAYLRAKDAVSLYGDDEAAHLALAQSADRLGKRDEAVAEYNAFLKLDPDGPRSKMVRKALGQLGSK